MPRAKNGRGGPRQGTPGRAYANRTDLATNYAPGTAAAGGQTAPATPTAGPPAAPGAPAPSPAPAYASPEDTPDLMDPTNRPNEPVTAGMPLGAGPGPEVLNASQMLQRDTQAAKRWLPVLEPMASLPDTPESVRALIAYIRGA